jgi:predicted MFS family arabinose efflux permease
MAVLWGLANALDMPARQSFIVDLVRRTDVASAVGLYSAAFNGARIIGPAVAGVLIARIGIAPAFALNSLAFAVAIGALLTVAARGLPSRIARATIVEEIREGLVYALREPGLRLALGLVVVTSFCVFNFSVYVPLLARNVLGLGSEGFGFLMTALGIGAVAAGLTLGALGPRQPSFGVIFAALGLACGGLVGMGAVHRSWVAAVLLVLIGATGTLVIAACNTSLQLTAPDAMRGRVMSLYTLLSGGIFPVGALWVGAMSEARGVAVAFVVNGALGLGALAALMLWWWRRRRLP